jgi:LmbE family N-acetylglucosaminyl deacetylase
VTVAEWSRALVAHDLRPMPMDLGRVVVVAAHPDDETLAAGGLLQALDGPVSLVVATGGEAAYPGVPGLAATRRVELYAAWSELGHPAESVTWLGLPDSALAAHEDALVEALRPLLADADACLAPWPADPHPDHAAAGRAARRAAAAHTHCFGYPIWLTPWNRPGAVEVPWGTALVHRLDDRARAAKAAAVGRFVSQTTADEPILPPDVLAHFATERELYFRLPPPDGAPLSRFAELYAADPDPWGTRSRWYEERKRAVLLASLPRERYAHAAEPGCGTGVLTEALAGRCDAVTASDPVSGDAARCATADRVRVLAATLPDPATVPVGVDLVVASEVLYYLAPADLAAAVDRIAEALVSGGDLVVVHWRGWPAEAPQDGAEVHRRLRADPRFAPLVEHRDEDFLLDVLRRR